MIEILAAVPLAFLVGISLGLLGGGGSILAVPILVYVLDLDPKPAIATSLVIVGVTSLVGAVRHARHGNLDLRIGLGFGAAGILGASAGSRVAASSSVSGEALLAAFAVLMVVVSAILFARRKPRSEAPSGSVSSVRVVLAGLLTGLLTGLLGVGGGFVIVPALLWAARLPIHRAVGSSLLIIALNCAAGLVGFLGRVPVYWGVALVFAVVGVAGSVVGAHWARRTGAVRLRAAFAGFLLLAGLAMLAEQAYRVWGG